MRRKSQRAAGDGVASAGGGPTRIGARSRLPFCCSHNVHRQLPLPTASKQSTPSAHRYRRTHRRRPVFPPPQLGRRVLARSHNQAVALARRQRGGGVHAARVRRRASHAAQVHCIGRGSGGWGAHQRGSTRGQNNVSTLHRAGQLARGLHGAESTSHAGEWVGGE